MCCSLIFSELDRKVQRVRGTKGTDKRLDRLGTKHRICHQPRTVRCSVFDRQTGTRYRDGKLGGKFSRRVLAGLATASIDTLCSAKRITAPTRNTGTHYKAVLSFDRLTRVGDDNGVVGI
jgi:hypothetical protein